MHIAKFNGAKVGISFTQMISTLLDKTILMLQLLEVFKNVILATDAFNLHLHKAIVG